MLTCKKCSVKVTGSPEHCPLCHGDLYGDADFKNNILPVIDIEKTPNLIMKMVTSLFIIISIACVGFNFAFPEAGMWSILVILGMSCLWISIFFIFKYKRNIIKNVFSQAILFIILACCWDNYTGYNKWANSYAVPIILIIAILAIMVVARVQRLNIGDYLFYFIFNCMVGVYSFRYAIYTTNQITVVYPTAICFIVSLSVIVLTLIFEHKLLASEIRRRMHF